MTDVVHPLGEILVFLQRKTRSERQYGDGTDVSDKLRLGDLRLRPGTLEHPACSHHAPQGEGTHSTEERVAPGKQRAAAGPSPWSGFGPDLDAALRHRIGRVGPTHALLNNGGGQDDRQAKNEEAECEGREPLGKSEVLGEHIDDLQTQHLPQ
jgi:hypothetical protein